MPHAFLQALWFAAPVICAGLIHIVIMKLGLFPSLARIPLDFGRTYRGRRLFGDNKTLRGAIVTPLATIAWTFVQADLASRHEWARNLGFVDSGVASPLLWGALLGLGYILGELPNSFLKRQLDIAPGSAASGPKGALFWFFDQVDSLVGILLVLCIVWVPPLRVVLILVIVTLVVHPAASLVMCAFKLKTRIG